MLLSSFWPAFILAGGMTLDWLTLLGMSRLITVSSPLFVTHSENLDLISVEQDKQRVKDVVLFSVLLNLPVIILTAQQW